MAKTSAERKADQRNRMLKLGYKRIELWVKSEFVPLIKEYSEKLHNDTKPPENRQSKTPGKNKGVK